MSAIAVAVGVGGAAIGAIGAAKGGKAAQKGAEAQADASVQVAEMQRKQFEENRTRMLEESGRLEREAMSLAAADPRELADLERAYAMQEKQLAREERFVNAIDPALMEASSQALKLLRGEETDFNKPVNAMRARRRQQIVNDLRSQFGPGAEHSSIGRQRLDEFDMETSTLNAQNRQGALAQTFGMATTDVMGGLRHTQGTMTNLAGTLSQGRINQKNRLLNTRMGVGNSLLGALSGTSQQQMAMESQLGANQIANAGAPYVGGAMSGNALAGIGNSMMKIGVNQFAQNGGLSKLGNALGIGGGGGGTGLSAGQNYNTFAGLA